MEGETALEGIGGRVADLRVTITPEGKECRAFTIKLAADGDHSTTLTYEPHTRRLTLDRSQAGFHQDIVHLRSCTVRSQSDTLSLRILLDRNSIEVFINGGEQTMTACIYTPPEPNASPLPPTARPVSPSSNTPSHCNQRVSPPSSSFIGSCTRQSPALE